MTIENEVDIPIKDENDAEERKTLSASDISKLTIEEKSEIITNVLLSEA